jgi:phage terminase large subunit-like protein
VARRDPLDGLEPFTVEHYERWAYKLVLDSGMPWVLEDFQLSFAQDLFTCEPQTRCWKLEPEGNGKTTEVAGIGLYHIEFTQSGFCPVAASTREQAEILYRQMEGLVFRSDLRATFTCQEGYRRIRCDSMSSRVQVYAADAGAGDGVIPTLFIIDELHRHKNLSLYRTWCGKLRKRGGKGVVISTAGEPGSEFEDQRAQIKQQAEDAGTLVREGAFTRATAGKVLLHDWAVPEGADLTDFEVVKQANPLKWVTVEDLKEKYEDPDMTLLHWRRFTCNLAASSGKAQQFIELDAWDALALARTFDDQEFIPPGSIVAVGADGSRTWDTTVIAWATPERDGVLKVDARVFSVREDVAHHVLHDGGTIDFDDVEAFLVDRFDYYSVNEVSYDPRYLERSMEIVSARLPDSSIFPCEPSSVHMRTALQTFYTMAAEGKLRHSGDQVLRAHVANANVERGHQSEIRRLTKIKQRLPIDAVPAMAMAVWRAVVGDIESVYETREPIEV